MFKITKEEFRAACEILIEEIDKEAKLQNAIEEYTGENCIVGNVYSLSVITMRYMLMCCGVDKEYASDEASWFVIETDFGRKRYNGDDGKKHKYTIKIGKTQYAIGSIDDYYNYITKVYAD